MTPESAVLKLLLVTKDREASLEATARLRPELFTQSYRGIYKALTDFYTSKGVVPTLPELRLTNARSSRNSIALSAIELVDVTDISLEIALAALNDQYAQTTALDLIQELLTTITLCDSDEIQEQIDALPLALDNKLAKTESVYTTRDINVFEDIEDTEAARVPTGISDEWDAETGGFLREHLILIGGRRGAGKSVLALNLAMQQEAAGNIGAFFSIEMTAQETYNRYLAMKSGIAYSLIKDNKLTSSERMKIAEVIASRYEESSELLAELSKIADPELKDFQAFQTSLHKLVEVPGLVIIDAQDLTIPAIDVQLGKLRSRYGERFKLAVVDYINVVTISHNPDDALDWKQQMTTSKLLKSLARKYDIAIASPYQISADGEARLAKGILDACDAAIIAERLRGPLEGKISFKTVKARGGKDDLDFTLNINWETLLVDPSYTSTDVFQTEKDPMI